jgi:hypothetical protein
MARVLRVLLAVAALTFALTLIGTASAAKPPPRNGISYHGGPVMLGTVNVYYIWYGTWTGNTATTVLPDLASNLGGSPYFNINTTYSNGGGAHVSGALSYGGSTSVAYPYGNNLSDAQVQAVVHDAINSGALGPADANGVYFVLTSADVGESSGFLTQYCHWHNHSSINGVDVKYAFVGDPNGSPSCTPASTSPNDNIGADAMANQIAGVLDDAVTDPDLNAWYTFHEKRVPDGQENADRCAWTFGTTYTTTNGAQANMRLGVRDYLIQQNWVNDSGGYCALAYP